MATAKEFIARVSEIDGVAGCLLVREDGHLMGQQVEDPEMLSSLLLIGGGTAQSVMAHAGFSYCRYLSFNREGKENLYVFPIDKYYLGVVQRADCYPPDMLEAVSRLVGRVTTSKPAASAG